ncbi:MAG: AmmeMemoRadiSam system radical SAM enzyme [Candidatus Omnitrophica bacterium]|nr:AmmeMemoRadiSam system radical SAM enzyme [Candidatus Omnitrophota bacterium]
MDRREFLKWSASALAAGLLWGNLDKQLLWPSNSNQEARYYTRLESDRVKCLLCPRACVISGGARGFCRTRENQGGALYSLTYGKVCSFHTDPIEKLPLFHFLPGAKTFSLAGAGCNLTCLYCQNWQISQARPEDVKTFNLTPLELVKKAAAEGCRIIAFTYTEPIVSYEYVLDTAKTARKYNLHTVIHTAGFINPEPLKELAPYLSAVNVDLKGFSDQFYQKVCSGSLPEVLTTLLVLRKNKVWVEVTNLVIPTLNDSPEEISGLCRWVKQNLGSSTPVHFSRFWPSYQLTNLPATPISTMDRIGKSARGEWLKYVYLGNIPGHQGEDTICPKCKNTLLSRVSYQVVANHLKNGACGFCGEKIPGIW